MSSLRILLNAQYYDAVHNTRDTMGVPLSSQRDLWLGGHFAAGLQLPSKSKTENASDLFSRSFGDVCFATL